LEATVEGITDLQEYKLKTELEALYSTQYLQNAPSGATVLLQFLSNNLNNSCY
jgi:23S rRNA maturation mini-RNase III